LFIIISYHIFDLYGMLIKIGKLSIQSINIEIKEVILSIE